MWVVVNTSEFGDTFVTGPFATEAQAIEALNHDLNILEDATKSLGHKYEITRGLMFGENDALFKDEESEDGDIRMEIRELQPFSKTET